MEVLLTKTLQGMLLPADEIEAEKLTRFAHGEILRAEVKLMRNSKFHRKFMALLRVGFDAFTPVQEHKGYVVQKEFEQFREDVTIAAGYYTVKARLNGTVTVRAKSISFGKMKQETFEQLYSNVANVLLQTVLKRYSREDLDQVVNRVLGFV